MMDEQVFVARGKELARLEGALNQSLMGQGQVVFLAGEAGAGKSALAREFMRRVESTHEKILIAQGLCNAQSGLGDPYLPFREVLEALTGDATAAGAHEEGSGSERAKTILQVSVEALLEFGPDLIESLVLLLRQGYLEGRDSSLGSVCALSKSTKATALSFRT